MNWKNLFSKKKKAIQGEPVEIDNVLDLIATENSNKKDEQVNQPEFVGIETQKKVRKTKKIKTEKPAKTESAENTEKVELLDFEKVADKKDVFNDNPYLTARREWNDHVGSVITQKQTWQFIGVFCLLITLLAVTGLVYVAGKSKFIPYVVEVDSLGQSRAVNILYEMQEVNPRIIHSVVSQFIKDARTVTPDVSLQTDSIYNVYAKLLVNTSATEKMNEFLNGDENSTPFARAQKEMVSVEIRSVLPQSPETWQVDWLETTRSREGKVIKTPVIMRALITVKIVPPAPDTTDEQIRKNPLGIYITDYSWSRLQTVKE